MPDVSELKLKFKTHGAESARRDVDNLGNAVTRTAGKFSGMGQAISTASGMMMATATQFLTQKIASFVGGMFTAASDTVETANKTAVVFDKSAASVVSWSQDAITALGMTQTQALAAAATYGNLFTAMGLTEKQAASMATGLVDLGADLSSFNNLDSDVVLEKLRAGLTGESQAVKDLGMDLSENAVQREAVTLGIIKEGEALTEAQKIQARYSLMLKQTTNAQGDFANTSRGAANAGRILGANFKQLQTIIGSRFYGSITSAINGLNDLFSLRFSPRVVAVV